MFKIKKYIPNLMTFINLFIGITVIVYADYIVQNKWFLLLLPLAVVFDFLDGYFARLFRAESKLGFNLDSLVDAISFGVAPMIVLVNFYGLSLINFISFSFLVFAGVYRLARFNSNPTVQLKDPFYEGLPMPFTAIIVSVILFLELPISFTIAIIFLVGFAMISRIKIKKPI